MGNLCSSGTDRSEKKEDKQLPKAKDGEDEALLSKVGEGAEGGENRQAEDAKAGGLSGMMGGALSDAVETAKDEGEKAVEEVKDTAAEVLEKGKEAVVAGKDAIVGSVTGMASDAKESAAQKASDVADDVSSKVESGKQSLGGLVSDIGSEASSATADASSQVKETAVEAVQSGKEHAQSAAAGIGSSFTAAKEEAISAVESSKTEATNVASQIGGEMAAVKSSAEDAVAESSSSSPGFLDSVKQTVQEKAEDAKEVVEEKGREAKQAAENYLSQAVETAKASALGAFTSASESGAKQVDGVEETTSEMAKDVEESASGAQRSLESGLAESCGEVEEMQSSVSISLQSAAGNVLSNVPDEKDAEGVRTGFSSAVDGLASDMADTEKSLSENVGDIRSSINDLPPPPPSPPAQTQPEEPKDSGSGMFGNLGGMATGAVATGVGFVGEKIVHKVHDLVGDQGKKEVTTESGVDPIQQSSEEAAPTSSGEKSGLLGGFGSTAAGAVETGVGVVSAKIVEKAQDFFGGTEEKKASDPTQQPPEMLGVDTKVEAAEEPITQSEGQPDVAAMPPDSSEESDFLEKAKTLLEQHRNSVDGTRMAGQAATFLKENGESNGQEVVSDVLADLSNNNNVEESTSPNDVADEAREETARDFVEGIIDKATVIVSESMATQEGQKDLESPVSPDPCVDHAEETMEPKKRGVCFASPQISSDQSFSSLSSPPEVSPPPPAATGHDNDLSPPSDASSISQGELVERDIELELPSSPPQSTTEESAGSPEDEISTDDHEQGILDNRRVQVMEETDESLQRIAMEVTTKAVQDAIKIVTENGTGATKNLNDLGGVSSPSSGAGDQEEEMTTTDSSQVECGSSVSDLTDTSQQGSIADSLSSYDPGAVYRQDLADLPDPADKTTTKTTTTSAAAATTSADSSSSSADKTTTENAAGVASPSHFDNDVSGSMADASTPTNNPSSAENNSSSIADDDDDNSTTVPADASLPSPPLSQSEVPSTFPTPLNEAMTKQPTIVINSPDSAPNTNGSLEDVTTATTTATTASSEALI